MEQTEIQTRTRIYCKVCMQTFSVYCEDAEMFCGVGIPHRDRYMEEIYYCPFCGSEDIKEEDD